MKSRTIDKVVKLAKEYVKEGDSYTDAVKKAEIEVSKLEREKYESKI